MFIPFRDELDKVVRSDKSLLLKVAATSIAMTFVGGGLMLRFVNDAQSKVTLTVPIVVLWVLASAAIGAVLGLALALKDIVRRRISQSQSVNPILKLYFGLGAWSLLAWCPTVVFIAFVITMVVAP